MERKIQKPLPVKDAEATRQPKAQDEIQAERQPYQAFHRYIYEKTGVWIEELIPIFQQLDAHLKK